MKKSVTLFCVFIAIHINAVNYYVDNTIGNDRNQGTSIEKAWKSIDRVNNAELHAGDSVLFKRGEIFRGNLFAISGSALGSITYSAYGKGNKPKIYGSIQKNSTSDWINKGGNIWQTLKQNNETVGEEILTKTSLNNNQSFLHEYHNKNNSAQSAIEIPNKEDKFYKSSLGGKIFCINHGNIISDILLYTNSISIKSSKFYKLIFRAKASQEFKLPSGRIRVIKNISPYIDYMSSQQSIDINTSWTTYEIFFKSITSASDARINFYLGNILPNGSKLLIDSISFKELVGVPLSTLDVGNIIFNNEAFCGIKVKNEKELNSQGEFWYDNDNLSLKMYSLSNPAIFYSNIEIAFTQDIINERFKNYVTYQNLDLRYGGAHGIGGGNTHHISIKDLDISYIGGGFLPGFGDGKVRYGNGIEFGSWANNNFVERCTFNQIYDAALTAQGDYAPGYEAYNLFFRHNIIRNCEFSFELWGRGPKSYLHDIYFENNTCLNAGFGWSHSQRPDPTGAHLIFWTFSAQSKNVFVRNNIFYKSSNWGARYDKNIELSKVNCDYNCWYISSGFISKIGKSYFDYKNQWSEYKSASGQDAHSIAADPLLNSDFTLSKNSPCIGAGLNIQSVKEDFNNKIRSNSDKFDIGAFIYAIK